MNITDLREELVSRTHEVHADAASIAEGVTGRIRTTKRRRVAGAAGGLGAAALALGLVLSNQGSTVTPPPVPAATLGVDGMPSRALPDVTGDVVKDGLRVRAVVGENTLVAGLIGDLGQRSLSASWKPTTNRISYVAECWLPLNSSKEAFEGTVLRASISGTAGYIESSCQPRLPQDHDLPAGGYVPGEPGQGHRDLDLGTEATLTVQLVTPNGDPTSVPGVRMAAAVYELGPQRVLEDDAGRVVGALPEVLEHQGYTYRLEALVSGPARTGPLPEVSTPAAVPFLVTYGSTATPGDPEPGAFHLSGLGVESSLVQGGGWSTVAQPARAASTVGLRSEGPRPKEGVAFIATYTPAD